MPPNVDVFVRMKLSNQAAAQVTSGQWQGILSLDNFAEMDKEGAELVYCQLSRHEGVDAAGRIKITMDGQLKFCNILNGGPNPRFCLMMDAIKQWEQGHRELDSSF